MSHAANNGSPDPDKALRLFAAIELPSAWREALAREARALAQAAPGYGRWVDPDLLHLTLVFLGWQPEERVATVERALADAACRTPQVTMRPGRLGAFGGRRAPRVIWAGIEDEPRSGLGRVRHALVEALRASGLTFDETPFHPHVTLARARRDAGPTDFAAILRALEARDRWGQELARQGAERAVCREVVLFRSDLRRTGPIYTPLFRAHLAARNTR